MAMDQTMADAFQAGSGMNPAVMKASIAAITGGFFFMLTAWLILKLLDDFKNERITQAQLLLTVLALAATMSCIILFLTIYR